MAIDFSLSAEQKALQSTAREFAQEVLKPLVAKADAEPDPQKGFRMVKPAYVQAYKLGLAMGPLPAKYGGGGVSNVDLQIVAEEICAVDPGFACILLVNGLALLPIAWFGSEAQKQKWLTAATSDPTGEFIAGWAVSEPAGTPGGTACFDHPDPHPMGHGTTAEHDKKNGEYVLNGRKYWPSSSAGWDFQGANVSSVTVRTDRSKGGKSGLSVILVPRGTPGMRFEPNIDKLGHRLNQNTHVVFENCRVPEENAFAIGNGDLAISKAFTWSGPVAGIAATAIGRTAYEYTLDWAKRYTAGGDQPIIMHQAPGYMLADVAMRIEACRYLCWKAAHYLDLYDSEGQAFGAMAKVYCTETMFDAVYRCMQVMGINSLDKVHPLEKCLREAAVLPIYDAGNVGMQRRKIWGVMCDADFDPRAFVDCKPIRFNKSMEGLGVKVIAA
ncbi:MAG: acyl-CoA/acyl-ACP dehydrogenase [Myxococcales bacterium]|nr:acyl-CoA/acyl-ACP dehydrogenase [Myxococcales bacterium]